MIVYITELTIIIINILSGFHYLKLNNKVIAIINFVLAAMFIILTIILAIQDINVYFYNKEIRKKYENKENEDDRT